jgi:hypothetical protein
MPAQGPIFTDVYRLLHRCLQQSPGVCTIRPLKLNLWHSLRVSQPSMHTAQSFCHPSKLPKPKTCTPFPLPTNIVTVSQQARWAILWPIL